eukprot:m.157418 g.157418  ORF g.157418 m.157418 type:complete len:348 (+) comp15117_c0_seq5:166-1209(+)
MGKLKCYMCGRRRVVDDFSAKQQKVDEPYGPEGPWRYCLRHTAGDQRNWVKRLERKAEVENAEIGGYWRADQSDAIHEGFGGRSGRPLMPKITEDDLPMHVRLSAEKRKNKDSSDSDSEDDDVIGSASESGVESADFIVDDDEVSEDADEHRRAYSSSSEEETKPKRRRKARDESSNEESKSSEQEEASEEDEGGTRKSRRLRKVKASQAKFRRRLSEITPNNHKTNGRRSRVARPLPSMELSDASDGSVSRRRKKKKNSRRKEPEVSDGDSEVEVVVKQSPQKKATALISSDSSSSDDEIKAKKRRRLRPVGSDSDTRASPPRNIPRHVTKKSRRLQPIVISDSDD